LAELEAEVAEVCGVLNVAHARLVSLVAEALATDAWQGWGIHSPAQWVAWQTGLSPARATQVVQMASRHRELPATMATFTAGRLAVDQVAVIARRVPAAYEAAACELATSATVTQLRGVVNTYPFHGDTPAADTDAADSDPDPDAGPGAPAGPAAPEPETEPERCSFHLDDEGRFHLHALGDVVGGATVEAALLEAKDALFQAGDHDATWWDALVEIAERSLAGVTPATRRDHFRVHLHVDITDPTATRARFTNGVPVPMSLRDWLCCDATVQPVWVRDSVPVGVGRTSRTIPERTRRLVLHRDHHHCQVPGCTRRRVEIHHIDHWDHHGPTETWNLLSVCSRHHRLHHQGRLGIAGDADHADTLVFTDPTGRTLPGCGTPAQSPPDTTAPRGDYTHPTGERLERHWITLDPRPG
jgi:hypothetical protein